MDLLQRITTLDFETGPIVGNPLVHPPAPVGLAVRWANSDKDYLTDPKDMMLALDSCRGLPTLFHNAPFDLSVAAGHLHSTWPSWELIHDTMYLVYLNDPYARSFALKDSAERYLGVPPDEQQAVKDWVLANVPEAKESNWGSWIGSAPIELLRPYALQDVELTFKLFEHLYTQIPREPYDRERQLMPILARATKRGIRVHKPKLEQALERYSGAFTQADQQIRATLQAPGLNPGSGPQLAQALVDADMLAEISYTPKGAISTAKKNLKLKDPTLMNLLEYRSTLKTLLGTFIGPWLELSEFDGRVHPNWNSTRGTDAGGTRTGRLSSSVPNFQNVPNPTDIKPIQRLPELPHMRDFVLPEEGHLWVKRDFSAQEIRIMAHFEDGALAEAFRDAPGLDPHEMIRQAIYELVGVDYPRKYVKETGFGILYGMGVPTLADRLGCDHYTAAELVKAYKLAIPGVEKLQRGTKGRGRSGQPIKTWGGRLIYCEPPKVVKGRMRSFEYKLLNYLIQGSSADQTKQCIIEWENCGQTYGEVFMATVHDEVNISVPEDDVEKGMEILRYCMEDVCRFDVPMLSEGFIGPDWGSVEGE